MADPAGTDGRLMLRHYYSIEQRAAKVFGTLLVAGTCSAIALNGWAAPDNASKKQPLKIANVATSGNKVDPDVMLIEVYKELAANRLSHAQAKADELVQAYPNFHLGHLIRGDLLLMRTSPVTSFGAALNAPADKLKNLRDEAIARIRSLNERPDSSLVPRAVLQMRSDQRNVLVVDAKRSRLYVYANQGGNLKFVTDYYVSQGKLGVDKYKEGDQRTPLGVYYITASLPGAKLPDFYGPGALPLSYPNEWDKLNGRGGSGIWLHGTPSNSYSRPPLSSDGCVVLTNPDLVKLTQSVDIGKTPVIISEQVEFVSRSAQENERTQANKMLEGWRNALESLDSARLLAHYSSRFKAENGESLQAWFNKQKRAPAGAQKISVSLKDVTFFRYPGREELIVGTFTQDASIGKSRHTIRKRQYWAREGSGWKIIAETTW
jgi:murein L,D-transpeptidase YafK